MRKIPEETFNKSFNKDNITPISEPYNGIKKREIQSPISFMMIDAKTFFIILANQI